MKKISLLLSAFVLGIFALNALAVNATEGGFTAAQISAIQKISSEYLVKNPEVLVEASQVLQQKQQQKMQENALKVVVKKAKDLIDDPMSPTYGAKKAKVALIEFYDQQCAYCHKQAPVVSQIMQDNKATVRYIGKQFPIFAQRWKASQYAAQMAIYLYQKQPQKFQDYSKRLFASGLMEGKLKVTDIDKFSQQAGIDTKAAKKAFAAANNPYSAEIKKDFQLGVAIGFQATPSLIVMPDSANPDPSKVTVFFGYTQADNLQAAINKAAS